VPEFSENSAMGRFAQEWLYFGALAQDNGHSIGRIAQEWLHWGLRESLVTF